MRGEGGQHILEFLHSFGIVLLVFIAVFLYLFSEGFLMPESDINPYCEGFDSLDYSNHSLTYEGTFTLKLKNVGIDSVTLRTITVSRGEEAWQWEGTRTISEGSEREVGFGGVELDARPGAIYRVHVEVLYDRGMITDRVERGICYGNLYHEKLGDLARPEVD